MSAAWEQPSGFADAGPAGDALSYVMPRDHPGADGELLADSASVAFEGSQRFVRQSGFGATFAPDSAVQVSGEPLGFDLSLVGDETIGSLLPGAPDPRWRDRVVEAGWVETVGFSEHVELGRRFAEHLERVFGLRASIELVVARAGANRRVGTDGPHIVAQVSGTSMLGVAGERHALVPGVAASVRGDQPAQLRVESRWATVIVASGRVEDVDAAMLIDSWQASVDLRRPAVTTFDPVRRALWRTLPSPTSAEAEASDPVAVRCSAPGGAVLRASSDHSLLLAVGGRLVSVPREWVYPLAVVLAGEPVSLNDLDGLFGGDRGLRGHLVGAGLTHGWLEANRFSVQA